MQDKKNNSENNQENKPRSLAKKLSFLWVIFLMIIAHFIVYYSSLEGPIRGAWFLCVWVFGIGISRYLYLYYYNLTFKEGQLDLNRSLKIKNSLETRHFNRDIYFKDIAVIYSVSDTIRFNRFCEAVIVKYLFGKKETKDIKRFDMCKFCFVPHLPKVGDKIEILYNKNDPTDSVILYQKAKKTKWYQWQPKYEIKLIKQ